MESHRLAGGGFFYAAPYYFLEKEQL